VFAWCGNAVDLPAFKDKRGATIAAGSGWIVDAAPTLLRAVADQEQTLVLLMAEGARSKLSPAPPMTDDANTVM